MADVIDNNDEPRYSSAAQCISLRLLGNTFEPEYTHQCFEGEWIRGYQPIHIENAHHTHINHEVATHELDVTVILSPSCEYAHLDLFIRPKKRERSSDCLGLVRKARRLTEIECNAVACCSEEFEHACDEENGDSKSFDGTSDLDVFVSTKDDRADAVKTRYHRMHPDEIRERLARALPKLSEDANDISNNFLTNPIGKVLREYTLEGKGFEGIHEFVLTLADCEQAVKYHSSVQNLALLFIENADGIELNPPNGGYWKVMYLFQKHGTRGFSLCGYVTLFHFNAPFRKPKPGIVMRICQVLILPPFQRQGHGKAMIIAIHKLAKEWNDIVEINVEDPAPAFVALRNRVDYEMFVQSVETGASWIPAHYLDQGSFLTLEESDLNRAAMLGCIVIRQVLIAYELYKLQQIPIGGDEKAFRLMVKKRCLRMYRENLASLKTKKQRQDFLSDLWLSVYSQYKAILKRT